MRTISRLLVHVLVGVLVGGSVCPPASGQVISNDVPDAVKGVKIAEHLGEMIPRPLMVRRSDGLAINLWDELGDGKPVILVMAYYTCPLLCPLTFETLARTLSDVDYTVGKDFRVVVVGFDPSNTDEQAQSQKALTLQTYDRAITPTIEDGFVFTIASKENARRLGDAIGFVYKDLGNGSFAHPAALTVLTPRGVVSRYIYSLDYKPRDVKLALLEATKGKIGKSIGDYFLHTCFVWDPQEGSFTIQAFRIMQLAGAATVVLLTALIGGLFLLQ